MGFGARPQAHPTLGGTLHASRNEASRGPRTKPSGPKIQPPGSSQGEALARTIPLHWVQLLAARLGPVTQLDFGLFKPRMREHSPCAPDMDWNFYMVSAWPGHERNLMRPYFAANCRAGIADENGF